MRTKLSHFLKIATIAFIALLTLPNSVKAGDYCAQINGKFSGTCEYGECSGGSIPYPGGNSECAMNTLDTTCCIEINPPSDTCDGGEGVCMGSCSVDGEWISSPAGNDECSGNSWDTACCIKNPYFVEESDVCANGQGTCQAGWCSSNSVEDPQHNDECSGNVAETICCITSDAPPSDTCANGNGECQAGWCSSGMIEDTNNNYECAGNMAETICCIPDGNQPPSDTCANGNGECQAGWCSSGMEEDTANNYGCSGNMAETICCVPEGETEEGDDETGDGTGDAAITGTAIKIPSVGLPDPALNDPEGRSGVQIILISFLDWILIIFLIASVIAFVITGLMYLLAMGNSRSELMDRAKNYFVYAIIAILITGSGLIIVNIVDNFLKGKL